MGYSDDNSGATNKGKHHTLSQYLPLQKRDNIPVIERMTFISIQNDYHTIVETYLKNPEII